MTAERRQPAVNGRALIGALWLPLLFWIMVVFFVTLFGYPGVICITPFAWLLAVPVGRRYVLLSGAQEAVAQRRSAALAGGLLGLLQGLTFIVVILTNGMSLPEQGLHTALSGAGTIVLGALLCAGLAALTARLQQRSIAGQ
ncbi:MAG: hypothetical protein VB089_08265 [Anaerolineaceae bacterium]|nr:hypothetical protein [Anaerolineaceae bacterium]